MLLIRTLIQSLVLLLMKEKKKYPEKVGHFGEMDLAAIVAEMTEEES